MQNVFLLTNLWRIIDAIHRKSCSAPTKTNTTLLQKMIKDENSNWLNDKMSLGERMLAPNFRIYLTLFLILRFRFHFIIVDYKFITLKNTFICLWVESGLSEQTANYYHWIKIQTTPCTAEYKLKYWCE